MNALDTQKSLKVVTALSNLSVTKEQLKSVNIEQLITDIAKQQKEIDKYSEKLKCTQEKIDNGNFVENWWHDREDAIKEASQNLSIAVGTLTSNTSKLIVFNTAVSKILMEQQDTLKRQQDLINEQTIAIKKQNKLILSQQEEIQQAQEELKKQTNEIANVNQGLLDAKGLTKEHAQLLLGIAKKTEALENNLLLSLEEKVDYIEQLLGEHLKKTDTIIAENRESLSLKYSELSEFIRAQQENIDNEIQELKNNQSILASEYKEKLNILKEELLSYSKKMKNISFFSLISLIAVLSIIGWGIYNIFIGIKPL